MNRENLMLKLEKLRADLKLKQFLQDTDDVSIYCNHIFHSALIVL